MESDEAAAHHGDVDKATVGLFFQGGLRRSNRKLPHKVKFTHTQGARDRPAILVQVRRSKTDQEGTATELRYLRNGAAAAVRQLGDRLPSCPPRPADDAPVLAGLDGQSIARCITAAASRYGR